MSAAIEIEIEARAWDALADAEAIARQAAAATLADAATEQGELCVLLADDARMRELNHAWRGQDRATNVLAFPAPQGAAGAPRLLGDVVLAAETVLREANEQAIPVRDHLAHLVVHGVLHLLGHDHENDRDAEMMEARERKILAGLGLPDPYARQDTRAEASP